MAGDQCMEDRGQIDLTSVSLSLHCQMFILFSVTDSGCAPSCVCVRLLSACGSAVDWP